VPNHFLADGPLLDDDYLVALDLRAFGLTEETPWTVLLPVDVVLPFYPPGPTC